jgi:hypothetical protein
MGRSLKGTVLDAVIVLNKFLEFLLIFNCHIAFIDIYFWAELTALDI